MFSSKLRAQPPTRRTAFFLLAVPALLAPLACTAILGDFTVGGPAATDGGGSTDVIIANDGPSDTTHFIDAVQIAAGQDHTCALRATGDVICWGDNSKGQLGTTSVSTTSATPVKVANLSKIRAIAAGANHTCAVDGNDTSGGDVYCWGSNSAGQLGSASAGASTTIPQKITFGSGNGIIGITAGADYTCGFDSGGTISCWGGNLVAQLGIPHDGTSHFDAVHPALPAGLTGTAEMSAGKEITCAISTNVLACWGTSNHGEIPVTPDGGTEVAPAVVNVSAAGSDAGLKIAHIASGSTHLCATETGGTAYCWGSNDYGESANNTTGSGTIAQPTEVLGISNAIAIGAGENYSCTLTAAKFSLSCWGRDDYGALGNAQPTNTDPHPLPSDVAGLNGVGVLSVGLRHACAIIKTVPTPGQPDTASGAAWCWGDNAKGQVGDGTSGNVKSGPVQVLKPPN